MVVPIHHIAQKAQAKLSALLSDVDLSSGWAEQVRPCGLVLALCKWSASDIHLHDAFLQEVRLHTLKVQPEILTNRGRLRWATRQQAKVVGLKVAFDGVLILPLDGIDPGLVLPDGHQVRGGAEGQGLSPRASCGKAHRDDLGVDG